MRARLYIDEDAMDDDLVQALRLRGADVQTALEAGLVGRPDEEHLAHAAEEGRVLYTFNVGDFMHLHGEYMSAGRAHAGIIFGDQQRFGVGEQMRRLLRDHLTPLGRRTARRLRVPQRLAVNINFTTHAEDGRMKGLLGGSSLVGY